MKSVSSIRKDISDINKKIASNRRKKTNLERELQELAKEKRIAEENFQANYAKRSQIAKSEHVTKLLKPLEKRRTEINTELENLKKEYEEAKRILVSEDLLGDSSDKQSILQEVKQSADKLRNIVIEIIGERFYQELESQLEAQEIITDTDKLEDLINYFNVCELEIECISKRSGRITSMVNKLQEIMMSINVDKENLDTKLMS